MMTTPLTTAQRFQVMTAGGNGMSRARVESSSHIQISLVFPIRETFTTTAVVDDDVGRC